MVGVMETRTDCDGVSASELSELARRFPDDPPPRDPAVPDQLLPRASVVVPTLCRDPPALLRTIDALLAQDYPDFEVIVVDNRHDARGTSACIPGRLAGARGGRAETRHFGGAQPGGGDGHE